MNSLCYIPFTLSNKEALKICEKYHTKFILNKHLKTGSVRKAYLPFYSASVTVDSYLTVFLKNNEIPKRHIIRHEWDGLKGDKGLQVFASTSYERAMVDQLKGKLFYAMRDMKNAKNDDDAKMLAFSIPPVIAIQKYVIPFVESREKERVLRYTRDKYGSWKYRSHTVVHEWSNFQLTPCYLPAFICESDFDNDKIYTYVDGITGDFVSGITLRDPLKVGCLSCGITSLLGLPFLQDVKSIASFSLMTFGLTYALISQQTLWKNIYHQQRDKYLYGIDSTYVSEYDPLNSTRWWDFEKAMNNFLEWQEREGARNEAERWAEYHQYVHEMGSSHEPNSSTPAHPDTMGFYSILGLRGREAVSTQEDIQRAFKTLAQNFHPDKQTQTERKAEAAKMFQQLSLAYSVLKDENKRRSYDLTGK